MHSNRNVSTRSDQTERPIAWVILLIIMTSLMMMSIVANDPARANAAQAPDPVAHIAAARTAQPPAPPKATRPVRTKADVKLARAIDRFARTRTNSPFIGQGSRIVAIGKKHNVDPRFIVAVATAESGLGTAGNLRNRNAYGMMKSSGTPIRFASWNAGTEFFARLIKRHYFTRGERTIPRIGARYAPGSSDWGRIITWVYRDLGANPAGTVTFPR